AHSRAPPRGGAARRGRRAVLADVAAGSRARVGPFVAPHSRRGVAAAAADHRACGVGGRARRLAHRLLRGRLGPLRVPPVADARPLARGESGRSAGGGVSCARRRRPRSLPALGTSCDGLGDLRLPNVITPARRAAYEVLLRVFEQDAYADRAFRSAAEGLDARERAFAQRLAYGSVQRVRTLDHAIEALGRRPVRKLDPPGRAALRRGAYQLGHTDTAPHAAVNESVELVRRAGLERAVPFTNAVMRRLSDGIRPFLDSLPDGPLKESYPDWIHEVFVRVLGAEGALALMRAMNEPLETAVRLVRGDVPSSAEPTDVPGAYRVVRLDEALVAEGRIWPQSRGSQLAGLCVGARDGERVLDLCAAPGGKTGQLRGEVTAVELDPARA